MIYAPISGHKPYPKPICVGCSATDDDDTLVCLHETVFICRGCVLTASFALHLPARVDRFPGGHICHDMED